MRRSPGPATVHAQPGPDTYQFITTAYTSGEEDNPLEGGNIQIHVFA